MSISLLASLVLSLSMAGPHEVLALNEQVTTVTIDAETVQEKGYMVDAEGIELHIPPGAFTGDTTVTIARLGKVPKNKNGKRQVKRRYRSGRYIYRYQISSTTETAPLQDLVVRVPEKESTRRRRLFYRDGSDAPWERQRTTHLYEAGKAQGVLTDLQGDIVLARHASKRERPLKKESFTPYRGLPYSDTAAVMDVRSGAFLYREQAKKVRPIASITKLATTLVFLESETPLDKRLRYSQTSDRIGATAPLPDGQALTTGDVLMGTLVASANNLAVTLSKSTDWTDEEFVIQMNNRMQELGLGRTRFEEPTGLNAGNTSTAGNVTRLARHAFAAYPETYERAADTGRFTIASADGNVDLYSTNKFDGRGRYELLAFKTGYLPGSAGRTITMKVRETATGNEIIATLLGNPTYNTIFEEAYQLVDWTFRNWNFNNL